jgi:hypothetical protein
MKPQLQPWHLLLLILAGWIKRTPQDAVEYLLAENPVLSLKDAHLSTVAFFTPRGSRALSWLGSLFQSEPI